MIKVEPEPLEKQARQVTTEARMVLPGVQAILGFQLVSVFNQRFELLDRHEQTVHIVALALVALSMALVMAPAAYHRQAEFGVISTRFITLASIFMTAAMAPLALGVCLDIYLVALLVLSDRHASALLAGGIAIVLFGLWFVLPLGMRLFKPLR